MNVLSIPVSTWTSFELCSVCSYSYVIVWLDRKKPKPSQGNKNSEFYSISCKMRAVTIMGHLPGLKLFPLCFRALHKYENGLSAWLKLPLLLSCKWLFVSFPIFTWRHTCSIWFASPRASSAKRLDLLQYFCMTHSIMLCCIQWRR